MLLFTLSFLIAATLGFAANRASLCTVRAIKEILDDKSARTLASFGKAALWAVAISVPMRWLWPDRVATLDVYDLGPWTVAGGLVFGMGAALNGACSFSTLSHLSEGHLSYLWTLLGFGAGSSMVSALTDLPEGAVPMLLARDTTAYVLVFSLWTAGLLEAWRLWRTRPRMGPTLNAERYRPSTAALVLGLGGGILLTAQGSWSYTGALRRLLGTSQITAIQIGLAGALFVGMWVSAKKRGSIRLRKGSPGEWWRYFIGGIGMGSGAALIPGGNAVLLLYAIPLLSIHAFSAYIGILTGVALVVLLGKAKARVLNRQA